MKKSILICLAAAVAAALSGCSTGRYVNNSANLNLNQTQVVLSSNNFRVVRTVSAYVEYTETLRGFHYDQLRQNAYAELIRKADLKGSQMLVNVTLENVQRAKISAIFGVTRKVQDAIMAQGMVIEFYDPSIIEMPTIHQAPVASPVSQNTWNAPQTSAPASEGAAGPELTATVPQTRTSAQKENVPTVSMQEITDFASCKKACINLWNATYRAKNYDEVAWIGECLLAIKDHIPSLSLKKSQTSNLMYTITDTEDRLNYLKSR